MYQVIGLMDHSRMITKRQKKATVKKMRNTKDRINKKQKPNRVEEQ